MEFTPEELAVLDAAQELLERLCALRDVEYLQMHIIPGRTDIIPRNANGVSQCLVSKTALSIAAREVVARLESNHG